MARTTDQRSTRYYGTLTAIYYSGSSENSERGVCTSNVPRRGSVKLLNAVARALSAGNLVPRSRLNNGSRMSREVDVRFCEGLAEQFPGATYPS